MLAKYERRAFDEGALVWIEKYRGLRNLPHWHFENELMVCLAGEAKVTLDGIDYLLRSGMCVFCPGEGTHRVAGSEESIFLVAQFDRHLLRDLPQCRLCTPLFPDRYGAAERMEEIYREYQDKRPFYAEKINALLAALMIDIFRGEEVAAGENGEPRSFLRYRQLLSEINRHCDEITFREAAEFMNMSESYFSRFFKRMSGTTFSWYLNVVRIGKAIDILAAEPELTVAEVMTRCGFNTLRSFNRVFRAVTGYAPTRLPREYVLHIRSLVTEEGGFDPTLESTEIMP